MPSETRKAQKTTMDHLRKFEKSANSTDDMLAKLDRMNRRRPTSFSALDELMEFGSMGWKRLRRVRKGLLNKEARKVGAMNARHAQDVTGVDPITDLYTDKIGENLKKSAHKRRRLDWSAEYAGINKRPHYSNVGRDWRHTRNRGVKKKEMARREERYRADLKDAPF